MRNSLRRPRLLTLRRRSPVSHRQIVRQNEVKTRGLEKEHEKRKRGHSRSEGRNKKYMIDVVLERIRLGHGNAKSRCCRPALPYDVFPIGAAPGQARERTS